MKLMSSRKGIDEIVEIAENKKINGKYFKLSFSSDNLSKNVLPGQFLYIKISSQTEPLFRRPLSYYRVNGKRVELLYEVLGKGTEVLSQTTKGKTIKIMGALGNSFKQKIGQRKRVLVAGGVGVPPMVFLAERCKTDYLLIGTKSKAEVLPKTELKKIKAKILHTTEDGSYGKKGFVSLVLEKIIQNENPKNLFIQTCGPKPMMRAVISMAKKHGISGEASWDEAMACGVGACLGCMVETVNGLKRACADGPVFSFKDLIS